MSVDRDIKKIIDDVYKTAGTGDSVTEEVNRRVADYVRRGKATADQRRELEVAAREAKKAYYKERDEIAAADHAKKHQTTEDEQLAINRDIAPEVQRAQRGMERQSSKILKVVQGAMAQAARTGEDAVELTRKIMRKVRGVVRGMDAEIVTAKSAIDNISRWRAATQAGREFFRYDGPSINLRAFCKERIGKTYHVTEIAAMDNRQGLPVRSHCGGYNCRHRWTSVRDKMPDDKQKFIDDLDEALANNPDFEGVLSHSITGRRLAEAFSFDVPGFKTVFKSMTADVNDGRASLHMNIFDVHGDHVGETSRKFHWENGQLEVYHAWLRIDKTMQGRGAAKGLMRNSVKLYDELGVDEVRVTAGLDGGHLQWGKFGFDFDSDSGREEFRHGLAGYIRGKTGIPLLSALDELDGLDLPVDYLNFKKVIKGVLISGLEWKQKDQFQWDGVLYLSKNTPTRRIFDEYTKKR